MNLLVLLLITAITFFPSNVLRIILGFPFVLFFPGYALVAALFPRKERMGGIERLTLSFGLSIVVTVIISLLLNYTPWAIKVDSILYSTTSFIFLMSLIAWFRQKRLPKQEHSDIEFRLGLQGWGISIFDKVLAVILGVAILGAFWMIGYAIAAPKAEQRFTEFYVPIQEAKAASYTRELKVGEEGEVMIDIVNHEYETVSYQIEVRIDDVKNNKVDGISLKHGEKWGNEVSFTPTVAGAKQKLVFLLYKNEEAEPILASLHLWIDVRE